MKKGLFNILEMKKNMTKQSVRKKHSCARDVMDSPNPPSQKNLQAQKSQLCTQKKTASTRIAVALSEKSTSGTGEQEFLADSATSEGSPNCRLFFSHNFISNLVIIPFAKNTFR